jgi:hypothetical protein
MSDLIGGGPSASAGGGRGNNGSSSRQAAPGTTGSPVIKGPRDIMRERAAREERKKEQQEREREAIERERQALEAQRDSDRRSAERRAAGVAQPPRAEGGQRGSGGTTGQRISDNSQRSDRRSGERAGTLQGMGTGGRAVGGGEAAPSARPRPTQSTQQPRPEQAESSQPRPSQAQAGPSTEPSNPQPPEPATTGTRSSFPHAFERWETLSAHWEGLTSFWIRRLEENSNEINRDPLSQQLSRQVTDLSAAGANLFHAVVELQRLRASSERKFQRWFFETRAEQERAQEVQAMIEASLSEERRGRATAIAEAISQERERSNADKQLAEMKRELQISKEEARRAWEELGRREQEERERTASLREGQPTIVGGVQVVPMMQGVPSGHGSTRDIPPTREGPYTGGSFEGGPDPESTADIDAAYQQYSRAQRADPADPFVEQAPSRTTQSRTQTPQSAAVTTYEQEYAQAPAVQPSSPSGFYQQGGSSLHPTDRGSSRGAPSEGAFSEGEYEIDDDGHFVLDTSGNKVPFRARSDYDTDEYDVEEDRQREQANLQRYGTSAEYRQGATATSGAEGTPSSSQPSSSEPGGADYTGAGYGGGSGLEWGAVPRHHHPTRLSDVLEEDERSRTSASQVSRRE